MTTTSVHPVVSVKRLRRRLVHRWRTLFAPGDLSALLIALAMLVTPALALNAAGWPLSLWVVLPVLGMSVLCGLLLARSQYNELFALIVCTLYGGCLILLATAIAQPLRLDQALMDVFTRVVRWFVDAFSGGVNQDELVFTLLVAVLFWFLGYNATWHMFRIDRVWRVILPPGLILAANMIFYRGEVSLENYMFVFLFLALLLIVRSNLDARAWDWYVSGIQTPRSLHRQFLRVGAGLAVIALIFAWAIPSNDLQKRLNDFQEFLRSDPLTQIGEFWNRLFASIDTEGAVTADYYGADSLELGGAIRLGEQEVFLVSAPPTYRYYWRSRVFDTYDRGRWTPAADKRLTTPNSPLAIQYNPNELNARTVVQQTFTMGLNASRLVYAAPQPSQVNLETRTDLRYVDGGWNISVIRPLKVIQRGDTYTAESLMSVATANELRAVAPVYPQWVQDLYINVPLPITERTAALAAQIVSEAGAITVYDKAKAIEAWLRANILYNETIPQPPPDRDPIDWVLFDLREGYCNYYASAMIVMLRSQGIPARMAAGFSQGDWDAERSVYVVEERDAHTWVEVYFPGYGWIEFEPTAAQAPLNRQGDNQSPPPVANNPTPTATPSPSPTPTIEPTLPATAQLQQQEVAQPTITPSFTPSPTATPVIVPTQPPPIRPQPRSLLSYLLPTLGLALLVLLLIILLVGLGILLFWWWEWRGMKGLSPVARAYARLERFMGLINVSLRPDHTPEERRVRIIRVLPQSQKPVTAITRMYMTERYGRGKDPRQAARDEHVAKRAWNEARSNILAHYLKRLLPWQRKKKL